jgi:hypothetical protein
MELTLEQAKARIAELERKASHSKAANSLSLRVGPKGGVSVYGLGRFPVTLYQSQWDSLIAAIPTIQSFMAENAALLKQKPQGE